MTDNNVKNLFLIFLFLIISCKKRNEFQKIHDGDFSIVDKGTYRGTTIFLRDGGEYKDVVDTFRTEIEAHEDVLPSITRKFFFVLETLIYKFKFVTLDKEKNCFILRYFARTMNHPVYAGYQIQFVFDVDTKNLIQIYTSKVPLE